MVYFVLMVKKQNIFHFLFINRGPDAHVIIVSPYSPLPPRGGVDGGWCVIFKFFKLWHCTRSVCEWVVLVHLCHLSQSNIRK